MPLESANTPVQKQRFSVYTMMLILSFIAICTACTLLFMELSTYSTQGFPFTDAMDASAAKFTPPPAVAP